MQDQVQDGMQDPPQARMIRPDSCRMNRSRSHLKNTVKTGCLTSLDPQKRAITYLSHTPSLSMELSLP